MTSRKPRLKKAVKPEALDALPPPTPQLQTPSNPRAFKNLRVAFLAFKARHTQAQRLWSDIENSDDVWQAVAYEEDMLRDLQTAFWKDTRHMNTLEDCRLAGKLYLCGLINERVPYTEIPTLPTIQAAPAMQTEEAPKAQYKCPNCYSHDVYLIVRLKWNIDAQSWDQQEPNLTNAVCNYCKKKNLTLKATFLRG